MSPKELNVGSPLAGGPKVGDAQQIAETTFDRNLSDNYGANRANFAQTMVQQASGPSEEAAIGGQIQEIAIQASVRVRFDLVK